MKEGNMCSIGQSVGSTAGFFDLQLALRYKQTGTSRTRNVEMSIIDIVISSVRYATT